MDRLAWAAVEGCLACGLAEGRLPLPGGVIACLADRARAVFGDGG